MTSTRILLVGATGKVGGAAARALAGNPQIDLAAGVRDPAGYNGPGRAVHLDLDNAATLPAALAGVSGLLLLTGYSIEMLRQSKRVLDAAKAAGVQHIVHVGASGNPTAEVAHWGWHRLVEAYIEQLGFAHTHLQPEAFMQNLTTFGWLQPGRLTNLIGDCRWSWVDAEDVGALAAEALRRPQAFAGQTWRLGYEAASMPELARHLSEHLGQTIQAVDLDIADFYAAAIAAGADPAYMACVRDQFALNKAGRIAGADALFDADAFTRAVGRPPRDWARHLSEEQNRLRAALGH
ncbi:hypothetical protein IP84_02375 [beta proteobacterium AAP99]|nr:hypothetical protein IP84_02375 [beta proteobacterium AAP99]